MTSTNITERVTFSQLSKGDRVQVMEAHGRAAELNDYIAAPAKAPRRARWGTVVTVERTKANTIITIDLGCNVTERLAFGSRTRITREIAASATVTPATDTERPAVPTVLPGQQVRITGGRWRGIETTPHEIQASGWLKILTNSRRGYGVERQNVAPGNWEPVPYANGTHDFAPTSGGTICVTPCLRPDGTVQPCGDPVKGAIHDPQAYAAYATELAVLAEPVSSEMLIVGSNLRHWGNDEHTACGSAGIMAVLTGSNAWCTTCKTVRDIEQA